MHLYCCLRDTHLQKGPSVESTSFTLSLDYRETPKTKNGHPTPTPMMFSCSYSFYRVAEAQGNLHEPQIRLANSLGYEIRFFLKYKFGMALFSSKHLEHQTHTNTFCYRRLAVFPSPVISKVVLIYYFGITISGSNTLVPSS